MKRLLPLLALVLAGCTTTRILSDYDEPHERICEGYLRAIQIAAMQFTYEEQMDVLAWVDLYPLECP